MTNDERDKAIREIWEVVRKTQISVAEIAAGCPGCRDTIKEHREALYGNGSRGIRTRLSGVELNVKWLWGIVGGAWAAVLIALQQWFSK